MISIIFFELGVELAVAITSTTNPMSYRDNVEKRMYVPTIS